MSITSPPSRKKNPREPNTCATIESIVRLVQAEPTGEDWRFIATNGSGSRGGLHDSGEARYTPDLFLVIGSVSVTLNTNELRPRYE